MKPLERYTQAEVHRLFEDDRYTIPCPPYLKPEQSEASPKSIAPQSYSPKAAQPLWQMDLRHKLGLEPGRNDAVAILLTQAIYSSEDADEAAERIEFDLGELQRALRTIREES